jgi:hypothetical protein
LEEERTNGMAGLLCRGGNLDDETNPSATDMNLNTYCNQTSVSTSSCTTVPEDWSALCRAENYNEASQGEDYVRCDCACGIWDPDCDDVNATLYCNPFQDSPTDSTDMWCSSKTLQCRSGAVPVEGSTVTSAMFDEVTYGPGPGRTKAMCDCGEFEEWDPDCDYQGDLDLVDQCDTNSYCNMDNECVPAPDGWTCAAVYYSQLTNLLPEGEVPACDCNCGIWDPDCDHQQLRFTSSGSELSLRCHASDSPISEDSRSAFCMRNNRKCGQAPGAWYGAPEWFNETSHGTLDGTEVTCHCGLGMYDPDCNIKSLNITRCGRVATVTTDKCQASCPNCVPQSLARAGEDNAVSQLVPSIACVFLFALRMVFSS